MNCARGCTDPSTTEPSPALVGHLCSSCALTIRLALRAIPDLIAHTSDNGDGTLTPGRESTDTTRRVTNNAPGSPSPAHDLADEACRWIYATALSCADANQHRGPFRYRTDGVPETAGAASLIGYVLDNLSWYATVLPDDIYDESTGWRRNLEKRTGQDELVHRIKTPCSRCNQRALIRRDGSDWVECRNNDCRARWHEDDFEWFAHVTAV